MRNIMRMYGWDAPLLPMNAKDAGIKKEKLLADPNYVLEKKIDGSRYLSIDGRFFSRRLSVKDNMPVEKTNNVPHLSEELKRLPQGTILDGEVYYPGGNSMLVTSVMGALPDKAIQRQALNPIRYCLFDITHYAGKDLRTLPWSERRALLEDVYKKFLSNSKHIDISTVYSGDKSKILEDMLANGEEGVMLKNVNAAYHSDKRPEHVWYKVKKDDTYDVIITGFEPGKGKYSGMVGAVVFSQYDKQGGQLVRVGTCSGFTDAMRMDMTTHPNKYINQVMEIHAMERTKDNRFRHPQFVQIRTDKSPRDCVIG